MRIYAIIITVLVLFILLMLIFVVHSTGYDVKLLQRLGLKEETVKKNWSTVGWINCLQKLDFDSDIVFFGDSITRGSDFRESFPDKKIINFGCAGDTVKQMTVRVDGVAAVKPEQVFVLGGINCLKDSKLNVTLKQYKELLSKLRESVPEATIYLQSVLPVSKEKEKTTCSNQTIRAFNKELEAMCNDDKTVYIDLYSSFDDKGFMDQRYSVDGIHLSPEGYVVWGERLKDYIK